MYIYCRILFYSFCLNSAFFNTYTGLDRPLGLQEVAVSRISRQSAHEGGKVVSHTHRPPLPPPLPPPGDNPSINFCQKQSRPQGDSTAGRIVNEKSQ